MEKNSRQRREWFRPVFWQVRPTRCFPVGFARHNSSLELATSGKAHLLTSMKQPLSRTISFWKPRSKLTPKEPPALPPRIAASTTLRWMNAPPTKKKKLDMELPTLVDNKENKPMRAPTHSVNFAGAANFTVNFLTIELSCAFLSA